MEGSDKKPTSIFFSKVSPTEIVKAFFSCDTKEIIRLTPSNTLNTTAALILEKCAESNSFFSESKENSLFFTYFCNLRFILAVNISQQPNLFIYIQFYKT